MFRHCSPRKLTVEVSSWGRLAPSGDVAVELAAVLTALSAVAERTLPHPSKILYMCREGFPNFLNDIIIILLLLKYKHSDILFFSRFDMLNLKDKKNLLPGRTSSAPAPRGKNSDRDRERSAAIANARAISGVNTATLISATVLEIVWKSVPALTWRLNL